MARIHVLFAALVVQGGALADYHGKFIGHLQTLQHKVSGAVYAASESAFYIYNFTYDGAGPDAFFWAGSSSSPDSSGEILPDERGTRQRLRGYNGENILIKLDDNKSIRNYRYLAVFCRQYSVNFGWVRIKDDFETPAAQDLGFLSGAHSVRADSVVLVDSRTIFLSNFKYDGAAPDAHFLVGKGEITGSNGVIVADEKGSLDKLAGYFGQNLTLRLREGSSWDQYDWFSVYCLKAAQDFAHIRLPTMLSVPVHMAGSPDGGPDHLGRWLGNLNTGVHGVAGNVYAASANVLVLQDFSYDGTGPDAYFLVGNTDKPDESGTIVKNEVNSAKPLQAYDKKTVVLKLPAQKKLTDFKWFSVYCKKAKTSFAHVDIPSDLDYPKPIAVTGHIRGAHNTEAEAIIVEDKKTLLLKSFRYDGSAPDAFFLAGKGARPGPHGTKIPDETGTVQRLKGYATMDLRLTLPGELTVDDIDWFSVYCISYTESFIQAKIPKNLNVPPHIESLSKQLQKGGSSFDNCEAIIPDMIQVGWRLETDTVTFRLRAKAMPGQWTAFGISGDKSRSLMVGADVAVVFIRGPSNQVSIVDYYLSSKAQCSSNGGVCPDTRVGGTDDLKLSASSYTDGIVDVVYTRKLATSDAYDKTIATTGKVAVVAAQGPTNADEPDTVLYHTAVVNRQDVLLQLNRDAVENCPPLTPALLAPEPSRTAFGGLDILKRFGVRTFRAQIGPTAGSRGYERVTGQSGWGIAWWINEELIPVLHVERGTEYTFHVEGGTDPENSAHYHPFYITDSSKGGGSKEDPDVLGKPGHQLFAGVVLNSQKQPDVSKGTGRYCEWKYRSTAEDGDAARTWADYKRTLKLECDSGQPGTFTWTPDEKTPDLVYYQCFTHYYLGWKILVTDPRQPDRALSEEPSGGGKAATAAAVLVVALGAIASRAA